MDSHINNYLLVFSNALVLCKQTKAKNI